MNHSVPHEKLSSGHNSCATDSVFMSIRRSQKHQRKWERQSTDSSLLPETMKHSRSVKRLPFLKVLLDSSRPPRHPISGEIYSHLGTLASFTAGPFKLARHETGRDLFSGYFFRPPSPRLSLLRHEWAGGYTFLSTTMGKLMRIEEHLSRLPHPQPFKMFQARFTVFSLAFQGPAGGFSRRNPPLIFAIQQDLSVSREAGFYPLFWPVLGSFSI